MEIDHVEGPSKGLFILKHEDGRSGTMSYSKAGQDKIIIDHTEVNPEFEGLGYGVKLVQAAVTFARENQVGIIPLCPFAKAMINKRPEWQDVLA
jgi:hypothetical protein